MLLSQFELGELFGKDIAQQIQVLCTNKHLSVHAKRLSKQYPKRLRGKIVICESVLTVKAWDSDEIISMLQSLIDNKKSNTSVSRWVECLKLLGTLTNIKTEVDDEYVGGNPQILRP